MAGRLVPVLTLAAVLAGCSTNTPPGSTIEPGAPNTSTADAGRGGARRGGQGGGRGDQVLLRGITLSADQQQRIEAIRTRYRTQMEQIRSGGDREAMRSQMRPLMEKQQAEIRSVLTADQQRQFDQNVAEGRSRMQGGDRSGGTPPS